jgi:hypothetical protein
MKNKNADFDDFKQSACQCGCFTAYTTQIFKDFSVSQQQRFNPITLESDGVAILCSKRVVQSRILVEQGLKE